MSSSHSSSVPSDTPPFLSSGAADDLSSDSEPCPAPAPAPHAAHSSGSSTDTARMTSAAVREPAGRRPGCGHVRCGRGRVAAAAAAVPEVFTAVVNRYEGLVPRASVRRILLQLRALLTNMTSRLLQQDGEKLAGAAQQAACLEGPGPHDVCCGGGSSGAASPSDGSRWGDLSGSRSAAEGSVGEPQDARADMHGGAAAAEVGGRLTVPRETCGDGGGGGASRAGPADAVVTRGEGSESRVAQAIQATLEALMASLQRKLASMKQVRSRVARLQPACSRPAHRRAA